MLLPWLPHQPSKCHCPLGFLPLQLSPAGYPQAAWHLPLSRHNLDHSLYFLVLLHRSAPEIRKESQAFQLNTVMRLPWTIWGCPPRPEGDQAWLVLTLYTEIENDRQGSNITPRHEEFTWYRRVYITEWNLKTALARRAEQGQSRARKPSSPPSMSTSTDSAIPKTFICAKHYRLFLVISP